MSGMHLKLWGFTYELLSISMKRLRVFILTLFLCITTAALSQAEIGQNSVEFGLYGGNLSARDGTVQIVDRYREIRTEIEEDGSTGGLRIGYNFNPYFALELSFEPLSSNEHRVTLTKDSDVVSEEITEGEGFFHGNVVLHLFKGRFVPYVTAGSGWILFVDDSSLAFNYGGGLKVFITERIALRFDVRDYQTKLKGKISEVDLCANFSVCEAEIPFTDELRFREISLGISYYIK